ncbi:head GIN domain-containing protein [Pontibacter korlensis]|uniref:Putative auto-transporter adhesin head GIN domain-containing protein n=1 Tax=Pontibacter korlensis TaxID=400092 RepID=A0A0E3UXT8_9BACT|nr:head GIN domain-containing protein [Pontibacter korlensis]AKD03886.1 hypothetical protein PKOR_13155 [Pontibacter korlensis]
MKILKLPAMLLASVALLATITSCDDDGFCLKGEGDAESRTLELEPFRGVDVSGDTKVYIRRGSGQQVEVRGQGNILDELETDVQNGVWGIEFGRCLRKHETVEVYITVPELDQAHVGGSGAVTLEDVFETRNFETSVSGSGDILLRLVSEQVNARISGSGTIRAGGIAENQDISISGSGKYRAFDVNSRAVEVSVSGSGEVEVNVDEQLDVDISGSGRVYYTGNPSVNSSISGSGKVIKK